MRKLNEIAVVNTRISSSQKRFLQAEDQIDPRTQRRLAQRKSDRDICLLDFSGQML
ncbi:hypothetical protein D3C71_809210 [compost metagenome]